MMTLMWRRFAAAGFLTLGIATTASPQGTSGELWKRVPPTPTSCYADGAFDAAVNAAEQALIADMDRQQALNEKVKTQFDAMDMMEKAQRMQAWMMKNPQEAARVLQAQSTAGSAAGTTMEDVAAATAKLEQELEAHKKALDAAVDRAMAPVHAREEALIKARTRLVGEAQVPMFNSAADYAAYVALIDERNATYEKACAPYFGPDGTFHRWLGQYRSTVTEPMIALEASQDAAFVQQLAIMDTPSGGYRSTAGFNPVRVYLMQLGKVSRFRRARATPAISLAK